MNDFESAIRRVVLSVIAEMPQIAPQSPRGLFSATDAAEYIGVSANRFTELRHHFDYVFISNKVNDPRSRRYTRASLDAWIEKHTVKRKVVPMTKTG